ncbi:hypothetical protein D030_2541 [Vibrio parahaemolyticus AQ3810]|nr:hypothetical protein D030_2541 [Vibrio parahaemolyticus AQ3810]
MSELDNADQKRSSVNTVQTCGLIPLSNTISNGGITSKKAPMIQKLSQAFDHL